MVSLLALLFLSSPVEAQACRRPVDPKRVVVFIDTNTGEQEIVAARRAACQRGERLLAIPQDVPAARGSVNSSTVYRAISALNTEGAQIVSMVISGHDGGGHYGSEKGTISRTQLGQIFSAFPNQQQNIRSLYLLGCYTSVRSEVFAWSEAFPNLALIGGYEERAPLSVRPSGHTYLQDLMVRESQAVATSDANALRRLLTRINGIDMLYAAVWVQTPQCNAQTGEFDAYYFRPTPLFGGERFQTLSRAECAAAIEQAPAVRANLLRYYEGEIAIPTDTTRGEVRRLYNFLQGHSHCFTPEMQMPTWDTAFALLFWEDFKLSAARWMEPEVQTLQQELQALTVDSLRRAFDDEIAQLSAQEAQHRQTLAAWDLSTDNETARLQRELAAATAALSAFERSAEGQRVATGFWAAQINGESVAAEQLAAANRLRELTEARDNIQQSAELAADSPDAYRRVLQYQLDDAITTRESQMEQRELVSQERVEDIQASWLPTPDVVRSMNRAQVSRESHMVAYNAINNEYPASLRARFQRVSQSLNAFMVEGRCLPMSWHEDSGSRPTEGPTCDPTLLGE